MAPKRKAAPCKGGRKKSNNWQYLRKHCEYIYFYLSEIQPSPDEEIGEPSTASRKDDKMAAQQHNREDMIKMVG